MKVKRLPNKAKVVQVPMMQIEDAHSVWRFAIPSDFVSLIDSLLAADGMGMSVVVYDHQVKAAFLAAGLLKINARHSCFGTPKLKRHSRALLDAYYKAMPGAKAPVDRKSRGR